MNVSEFNQSDEIISILKSEIENFDEISKDSEVGTVVTVGDGIATIYGIDHAMYGEIVTFENGLKGMVQDIQKDEIGCILFGSDTGIKEGTKVARTKKKAGIPVGDKFIGRVINALGAPIDGAGEIEQMIIARLKMKHLESLTENPSAFLWRQESFYRFHVPDRSWPA